MTTILFPYLLCIVNPIVIGLELRTLVNVNGKIRIKQRPLTDSLEFRPAHILDKIRAVKDYTGSGLFVAVDTPHPSQKAIAGSAEFGVVQTEHYGDWVYINNVFAHEEYKNVGVEAAILRRLVEYVRDVYSGNVSSDAQIHKEDPGIVAVWARHFPDDFEEEDAYTQAGFEDRGAVGPVHNLVYAFPRPTPERASRSKGGLPIISDKRLESLFNELVKTGVVDEVYSNWQSIQ
ncbi:hypothetical protein Pmar_PMAR013241 [Perkinsus marinus ATCC 50983]|uniref:Uncharacterized protein n=1 Tax=Perkinsus marinus (strain ATCC 50983 / TXsc) TaxID=423536 RepID=C5LEV0_PERM5|nr:hypothetical protein Pmar_PMAR013241 [Perkinsus marinus ATCC 50983]EER04716.1 hypothetical protein Pmar_PMAR013241 [Perkinsus marinus ATCC 50983]|eukprot:XP_002772900.1 hypothetical protein Pmar_PMAR013241 [Perkinsus marinus ATCC 50983]